MLGFPQILTSHTFAVISLGDKQEHLFVYMIQRVFVGSKRYFASELVESISAVVMSISMLVMSAWALELARISPKLLLALFLVQLVT